jgi:aldose 1-epimerase
MRVPVMSRSRSEVFDVMKDGHAVRRHVLTNCHGASVSVIDFGAIITSIIVPDAEGRLGEVTLGHDTLAGYLRDTTFLGAIVGRYANRIAHGNLELLGTRYHLPLNDGGNHLHGGPNGFYRALWRSQWLGTGDDQTLELSLVSPSGDAGYPGELQVFVRYSFDDNCRLSVEYEAATSATTVINLTQHSYFNLACGGSILDHEIQVEADFFTPTDATMIPTGEIRSVAGTPFDFREPHRLGSRIGLEDQQLVMAGGYDHNFVLRGATGELRRVASVYEPKSGRRMRVLTTEPGMHLYTGNFLPSDGSIARGSMTYGYREGFCLETQHFPDSPNHQDFPSTRLDPGQRFHSKTIFEFSLHG